MRRRFPSTLRANIMDNMSNVAIDRVIEDLDRDNPYQSALLLCLSSLSRLPRYRTDQSEQLRTNMFLPADVSEQHKQLRTPQAFEDLAHQTYSYVLVNGKLVSGQHFGYLPYVRPGGRKALCMTELPLGENPLTDVKHASRRDLFPMTIMSVPRLYGISADEAREESERVQAKEKITRVGALLHIFARDVLTAAGIDAPETTTTADTDNNS